jgi:SAM-dependent methyltransferase
LVGKLGLGGVTRFTGAVPHSQVPEYLDQLDIYVAVSIRESESFGVAVLEASACGLPVVVSAVGGLPEVVVDGVTGFVVEKKDALATAEALLRLIEDPRLRQSMGESGRQHVFSRYQWAESARLMEDVYRRVGTPSLDHIECPSCYVVSASAATILPRSWRNSMFHLLGQVMPSDHSRQVSSEYYLEWALGKLRNVTQVMDLGCGAGDFLDYFRKKDASIRWVGLDIEKSPEVDSRTRTGGEFCTYDGVHIPFGDNSFDLIYCKQVFEHVRYPLPLLKQIHRVLKPNGYFVGSTSQLGPYHSFSFWNYTPYGFLSLLEEASLQLIEIRPGIDGPTLILRRSLGTSRFFDRWFSRESPFNRVIGISGRLMGKSHAWINAVKLLFCGHFCFLVKKKVDTTTLPRPSTAETDAFDLP